MTLKLNFMLLKIFSVSLLISISLMGNPSISSSEEKSLNVRVLVMKSDGEYIYGRGICDFREYICTVWIGDDMGANFIRKDGEVAVSLFGGAVAEVEVDCCLIDGLAGAFKIEDPSRFRAKLYERYRSPLNSEGLKFFGELFVIAE